VNFDDEGPADFPDVDFTGHCDQG